MKKINPTYFWPRWYLSSLAKEEQAKINPKIINNLSKAQVYLWNALNIYDDILDESKDAKKLPVANKYMRRYLEIFYRLNLPKDFYYFLNSLLDNVEAANKSEYSQKRLVIDSGIIRRPKNTPKFKNLKDLSKKSLALCTGPLAILYLINNSNSLKKAAGLINFFRYTLAAKQLSDDAKDWLEDLKMGAITYPNSLILNKARKNSTILDLKNKPEILYLFFIQIASKISSDIMDLCVKARHEAKKINLAQNNPLLLSIILPLEMAVIKAQKFNKLLIKNKALSI